MAGSWLPTTEASGGFLPSTTASQGSWLPASTGPTFGSGVSTSAQFGLGTPGQSLQQSVLDYGGSGLGKFMQAQQDELMRRNGLDPAVDSPDEMITPEMEQAKVDSAIARIATLNPDLAETLAAKHSGTEQSEGFFSNMKDLLGDIAAPALSLGGKALELLTRPAQIIPELIVDKEGDAWYEDIGQALSGKSEVHGADVIEKFAGEGTNPWVKGIAGFAVDVLADPLTWLTFGSAAVGREAATLATGKAVLRKELMAGGVSKLRMSSVSKLDELSEALVQHLTEATGMHVDTATAYAAATIDRMPQATLDALQEVANPILRQGNRTGLANLSKEEAKKWLPYFEQRRSELQAIGTKGARQEARALAGSAGGVRFVAAVPFTKYRFISAAVPGTYGFGFAPARNFFTGMSGLNRLGRIVDNFNPGEREAVYKTFFEKGWKGIADAHPQIYDKMASGRGNFSMLRTTSERVGKITRGLSNHAQYYRNGDFGSLYTKSVDSGARSIHKQFLDNVGWTLYDEEGKRPIFRGPQFKDEIRKTLDLNDPAKKLAYAKYMETVPLDPKAIEDLAGWEALQINRVNELVADGVKTSEEGQALIEEFGVYRQKIEKLNQQMDELGITPGEKEMLHNLKRVQAATMDGANRHGARLIDRGTDLESMHALTPGQAEHWARWGRSDVAKRDFYIEVREAGRIGERDLDWHDEGRGLRVSTTAPENMDEVQDFGAFHKAKVRVQNPLILDGKSNQEYYDNVVAAAKQDAANFEIDETMHSLPIEEVQRRKVSEGIEARLRADGWDAVLNKKGANFDGVVLGPGDIAEKRAMGGWNVKIVDDLAPVAIGERGYFPRMLTEDMKEILGEKMGKHRKQMFLSDLDSEIARSEEFHRLDIEQANARMREIFPQLGDKDAFVIDPLEAHARYVERVAEDVARHHIQGSMDRFIERSHVDRWGQGTAVNVNSYEFKGVGVNHKNIRAFEKSHKVLIERNRRVTEKLVETAERHTVQNIRDLEALKLQASMDVGGSTADAVRRFGGRMGTDAASLAKQLEKQEARAREITKLLRQGKDTDKLMREMLEVKGRTDFLRAQLAFVKKGGLDLSTPEATLESAQKLGGKVTERARRLAEKRANRQMVLDKLEMRQNAVAKEIDDIRTTYETEVAAAVPSLIEIDKAKIPPGWVTVTEVAGMEGVAAHPYIHAELVHALGNKPLNEMRKMWRQFVLGPWKAGSTVYYPGFHARNFMGAYFNNALGGVAAEHYWDNFRATRALKGDTKWTTTKVGTAKIQKYGFNRYFDKPANQITWYDVGKLMEEQGVRSHSAGIMTDVFPDAEEQIRRMGRKTRKTLPDNKVTDAAKWYSRTMRGTTEVTENLFRGSAWLKGMEDTHNLAGSRAFVMMRHGDYEDLNDYEQGIKDLVPFYKWMRTNIPFQFHRLLEAPGAHLAVIKSRGDIQEGMGVDQDEANRISPSWVKDAYTIPVGKTKGGALMQMTLDLPFSDLFTGANDYISATLPMIRPILESTIWKSRMGPDGKMIPLGKDVPLASWATVPGIRQVLQPWIKTGTDGKDYINGKIQNVMQVIPVFARFKNWVYESDKTQARRGSALVSAAFGLRFEELGTDALLAYERNFMDQEINPLMDTLKALGTPLPTAEDLDPAVFDALGLIPPKEEETSALSPF